MKRGASAATWLCVAASAGCTLLHSFGGFSDEYGTDVPDVSAPAGEGGSDVSVIPSDAPLSDGGLDADPARKVSCQIQTVADGLVTTSYGIVVGPSYVYVLANDSADGGTIHRIDKAAPDGAAPFYVSMGEPIEGCVWHDVDLVCAMGSRLVKIDALGKLSELRVFAERLDEIDDGAEAGVLVVTRAGQLGARAWFYPWNATAAGDQRINYVTRVRARDDHVFAGHEPPDASFGLRRYEWPSWTDPDAGGIACNMFVPNVSELAARTTGVYAINDGVLVRFEEGCPATKTTTINGNWSDLAASDDMVFVRSGKEAHLFWSDLADACADNKVAQRAARGSSRTAEFDDGGVYFLAPPRLMKMVITPAP